MEPMTVGAWGPRVAAWQRALNEMGYRDDKGHELTEDGDFGIATMEATNSYRREQGFLVDGTVTQDMEDVVQAVVGWPFIQAANYTRASRTMISLIVFHTMEAPEKPKTAAHVAAWFAGPNAPQASAHFCVDDEEVIQTVRERDIAWHAPGANHNGIGVEHAGYASQTPDDWADTYSDKVLANSARLVARLCHRWGIPVVWLEAKDLVNGERGITGHKQVTDAFNHGVGHFDPGPNFPKDDYIARVRVEVALLG